MEKEKRYKALEMEEKISVVEDSAVALSYGLEVSRQCVATKHSKKDFIEKDERELISEEAWNSRPGVYTDEEFAEELRLSEISGTVSHKEVMEGCARWRYAL